MPIDLAIKVDVDTDRGTRVGVPNLLRLFNRLGIKATFLFALGPDNTGRAIKRIFRPGFFKKVQRTNVIGVYGLRTLLNGVLLPGPHIGRRNEEIMRAVRDVGHEVGIHCYDHVHWQDGLAQMSRDEVHAEVAKARCEFERVFGIPARTAGAAGWQANAFSLSAYENAEFYYASDTRGTQAFFPRIDGRIFQVLQIPTTLPTLDELLGRPEYPLHEIASKYLSLLRRDRPNIFTVHAEIEGMAYFDWFAGFLDRLVAYGVHIVRLDHLAARLLRQPALIPVCDMIEGTVEGRSGTLAVQSSIELSTNRASAS